MRIQFHICFHCLPLTSIYLHVLPFTCTTVHAYVHRLSLTSIDVNWLRGFHTNVSLFPLTCTDFHRCCVASTQSSIQFSRDFHEHPDRVRSTSIGFHVVMRFFGRRKFLERVCSFRGRWSHFHGSWPSYKQAGSRPTSMNVGGSLRGIRW